MTRFLLAAILLLAGLCWLPCARAATTCTASATDLAFAPITVTGTKDTAATITIRCDSTSLLAVGTVHVNMCLNIGAGDNGSGQTNPRRMTKNINDVMQFQIYRDAARSLIWGDSTIPATSTNVPLQLSYDILSVLAGGSGNTSTTIYARIPEQPGLTVGSYNNHFTGMHTRLDYSYDEPVALVGSSSMPTSCTSGGDGNGTTTFPFTARADVGPSCLAYTTTELNFGSVTGNIATNLDQTSTIGLTCISGFPWQLGLDNGQHASGNTRRMQLGETSNYVSYELYRDAGRSQRWGGTLGTDTVPGTSTGSAQTVTVYGRVPAPQTPAAGSYSDTITVTITY